MDQREIRVDARGHINISFRQHKNAWYFFGEDPDGTIHLTPAVLVPAGLAQPAGQGHLAGEKEDPFEPGGEIFEAWKS